MNRYNGNPDRFRRITRAVAGCLLLVGMLVAAPVGVSAADPEPSYTASFDACPEDVIDDAGFTDVGDRHPNVDDINCIAYYGITKGKSATIYAPDDAVTREHMALFLVRMAERVGIDLPDPGSTPFTDIGNLSEGSREAISQIYELEITRGTSRTTYTPARDVTRGEMALFLSRLMDQMDTATDGVELYGYVPDDVNDNDENHDVESLYQDLDDMPYAVHEAVLHLYELGVGSGLKGTANYGSDDLMTRAAMAEFMAAILDHSNLRPDGISVQLLSERDGDKFKVTAMIAMRDNRFRPVAGETVDWFYTDDPAGGLQADGACDTTKILGQGDCVWRDSDPSIDPFTDREGNIFQSFEVALEKTITVYAWVGRRNGEAFDETSAHYSKATARLTEAQGGSGFRVTHNVPTHAAVMRQEALMVDRRSRVEFTIQLLDSGGEPAAEQGTEIIVEVGSQEISVDADAVSGGKPRPTYSTSGTRTSAVTTLTTDQDGQAVYSLTRPTVDEQLDTVTISTDCCDDQIFRIAWSDSDPVLTAAIPTFDPYQYRTNNEIDFDIEYLLYDQYGELVDRRTDRYKQLEAEPSTLLYEGDIGSGFFRFTVDGGGSLDESVSLWKVRATIEETGLDSNEEYFILLTPNIFTESGNSKIIYADPVIVWIVENARSDDALVRYKNVGWGKIVPPIDSGLALQEVEIYPSEDGTGKFRTFFTMWSYDSESRLEVAGKEVDVAEFVRAWRQRVDDVDDLEIPIYGPVDFIRIE